MVPILIAATERYKERAYWATDADWQYGVLALNRVQEATLTGTQTIVDAVDRLYRLMDTTLNGTQYSVDDQVVTPAIPAVPPVGTSAPNALRAHVGRLWQLSENLSTGAAYAAGSGVSGAAGLDYAGSLQARLEAVQGVINAGWFGIGGQPATLADLVASVRVGTPQAAAEIDTVLEALSAASSTAGIFDVVRGLLGDAVDTGLEGGILGVLIAASLTSAASSGMMAAKVDRLIAALDGGGLVAATPPPAGSILGEITVIKEQLQ